MLEVRFGVRNIGDLDAEVYLTLDSEGSDSSTLPRPSSPRLMKARGPSEAVLVGNTSGTHDVALIDPTQVYEDPDRSDNTYTFSFVEERPVEPMRFLQNGQTTQCPRLPFRTTSNYGWTTSVRPMPALVLRLQYWDDGWIAYQNDTLSWCGSSTVSGYSFAQLRTCAGTQAWFAAILLDGTGVEIAHNELQFNVCITDAQRVEGSVSLTSEGGC